MIIKTFLVALILSVAIISGVSGATYSNVYVHRQDVAPVEPQYFQYGSPYTSIASPGLSQIKSLPAPAYVSPCGVPCYPTQTVAVTPVQTNANVLTYNPPIPSVPVIVSSPNEGSTGYEYSYVVYDENTGDHKAQREVSDGSVVRGEYSFSQPDGYIREVKYVADDITGFNAVVKKFLPVATEAKRKTKADEKKESSVYCQEAKSETLKEKSEETSKETPEKPKLMETKPSKEGFDSGPSEESEEKLKQVSQKESKEESEQNATQKNGSRYNNTKQEEKEESGEININKKVNKESEEEYINQSNENSKENNYKKPKQPEEELKKETGESSKEKYQNKPKKDSSQESKENSEHKQHKKYKHSKGDLKAESEDNLKEKTEKDSGSGDESIEISEENHPQKDDHSKGELEELNEKLQENNHIKPKKESKTGSSEENKSKTESRESAGEISKENYHKSPSVPYSNILRCIQASIKRAKGDPSTIREEPSQLTNIILNSPC